MNNKHNKTKKKLKIFGFIFLFVGIALSAIGTIDFFIGFNSFTMPTLFWLDYIGFPCIAIGVVLLNFGYRREISTYMKDEHIPVVKEAYHDVKPEIKDFVNTIKGNESNEVICPKCHCANAKESRFCKNCGERLEFTCPHCGSYVGPDSMYCSHCGKKIK